MWTGLNWQRRQPRNLVTRQVPYYGIYVLAMLVGFLLQTEYAQASSQPEDAPGTGWGGLRGRIVIEGDVPTPEPLDITKDQEVCGTLGLRDESLLVDPSTKGIRHVMIWLESREPVPIHPELEQSKPAEFEMDNRDCRFEPHMLAIRTGVPLLIRNSDPLAHNAAVYVRRNQPFSEVVPATGPLKKSFSKAEALPVQVNCSIHPWMQAWILILDHPYAVATNEKGEFSLKNIPAGKWKFRFWHERGGWLKDVNSEGQRTALEKGAWEITIPADGEVDLGTLQAPVAQFKRGKK